MPCCRAEGKNKVVAAVDLRALNSVQALLFTGIATAGALVRSMLIAIQSLPGGIGRRAGLRFGVPPNQQILQRHRFGALWQTATPACGVPT